MLSSVWIRFAPRFVNSHYAVNLLHEFVQFISNPDQTKEQDRYGILKRAALSVLRKRGVCDPQDRQKLVASIKLLVDLVQLGWSIRRSDEGIELCRPNSGTRSEIQDRACTRAQLNSQRDEQLRLTPVRDFIRDLETRKPYGNQLVSIFSLMRNGPDLARQLQDAFQIADISQRITSLQGIVRPYLQFVREEETCPFTGIKLVDIWRYFRYTWANPQKSIPGRTMMVLIRDAAVSYHPVMGIAALSSAAVAVTVRDQWIGWTPDAVVESIVAEPSLKYAKWMRRVVDQSIDQIYTVDLVKDKVIDLTGLRHPTGSIIRALDEESLNQKRIHQRMMAQNDYKKGQIPHEVSDEYWVNQACMPLFRSKRCEELARMLRVRIILDKYYGDEPTKSKLMKLLASKEGKEALSKIVRKAKAERVGTAIADLTVCGAVPPYNELLAGKLVAMMMTSPEVVREYRRRYGDVSSVIASSMAGQNVKKQADLVFVGTTSLYSQRPSQYDRITIPCSIYDTESNETIKYAYLGKTIGMGTFQFSDETVNAFQEFLNQTHNGARVNSIFGEGVNPRLRKIRTALAELGLPQDEFLDHGAPRLVYGVRLVRNLRDYLLGLSQRPDYLFSFRYIQTTSQAIVDWWMHRWVAARISKSEVIARISSHSHVYPITHGARVVLPDLDPDQLRLFD